MAGVVNLQDIVDELSMMFDEMKSFVNRDTGEVGSVSLDELRAAEKDDDNEPDEVGGLPEEEAEVDSAWAIASNPERYAWLPSKYDVNAWEMMRDFCIAVESPKRRDRLLSAIQGRGAFRYFKDLAGEYGILDEWYAFEQDALREIARDWCTQNGIPYTDQQAPAADSGTP